MAIIRKMLKANLPKEPPKEMPKAIPLFSIKWIRAQSSPRISISWLNQKWVLIQIFTL
jgi:hypothetical protein